MAGPKRPQDRVALPDVWDSFVGAFRDHLEPDPKGTEIGRFVAEGGTPRQDELPGEDDVTGRPAGERDIGHGSVVIAAITSCTNTSNPSVMLAAGCSRRRPSRRADEAVGEDVARAGLAGRDRLPRPAGLTLTSTSSASRRRVWVHDLHR